MLVVDVASNINIYQSHLEIELLVDKKEYSEILNSCYDFIRNIKEQKIFSDRMYHRFAGIIIAPILTNLKFYNYLHYYNKSMNLQPPTLLILLPKILNKVFLMIN